MNLSLNKKQKLPTGWHRYSPIDEYSVCFYQKRLTSNIYFEITEYPPMFHDKDSKWEARVQLHENENITSKTVNITVFSYDKLDFKRIEDDIKDIVNKLLK